MLFKTTVDAATLAALVFRGWSVTCGEAGTGWATGACAAADEHRATEAGESGPPSELCMLSSEERRREGERAGLQPPSSKRQLQTRAGQVSGNSLQSSRFRGRDPARLVKEEGNSLHNCFQERERGGARGLFFQTENQKVALQELLNGLFQTD